MIWIRSHQNICINFIVLILCLISSTNSKAQDSTKIFEGYIYAEDSLPVENAYVINYRTQKIVMTDENGYFHTPMQVGDSLMINHVSLSPTVIHANTGPAFLNVFVVDFKMYTLKTCVLRSQEKTRDMKNFETNIAKIYDSLKKEGFRMGLSMDQLRREDMPFFMDMMGRGPNASVNLLSIRDLLKQHRMKKIASTYLEEMKQNANNN